MQLIKRIQMSRSDADDGFTLPEVIVAAGIVTGVVLAFTMFMMAILSNQASARLDLVASRVAADQIETMNGIKWDDLMVGNGECDLTSSGEPRRSTAAVKTGGELVTVDNTQMSITRNVQWNDINGAQVVCANGNGDGLKVITVNVTYNDGTVQRTETLIEGRSRFAENG